MWGTYFVKHLKGNSGNQVQKLRTVRQPEKMVAHAVVYAKKVELDYELSITDDTPECQALWETMYLS